MSTTVKRGSLKRVDMPTARWWEIPESAPEKTHQAWMVAMMQWHRYKDTALRPQALKEVKARIADLRAGSGHAQALPQAGRKETL